MATTSPATFRGSNLRVARNFQGYTLKALADRVGVSHSAIHHLETEIRRPSEGLVAALAETLEVRESFFFVPIPEEFREDECQFRGSNMPGPVKTRVLAHGTLFGSFVRYADSLLNLPEVAIPALDKRPIGPDAVERAAENCRRARGIGVDRPAVSMSRLLENMGVVVIRFEASTESSDAHKVDAFSRVGTRPIVVLNTDKKSTSRARFDMAHELGHLVMHGGLRPGDPDLERDADQFASAFLLPRTGFLREFHPQSRLDWEAVFALKRRWKASAASIVRRAFDLGRIDAVEYRRAWKHYMYRRWHKGEPDEPPDEAPELVPLALEALEKHAGVPPAGVASALGWTPATFHRVLGIELKPPAESALPGGKLIRLFPMTA